MPRKQQETWCHLSLSSDSAWGNYLLNLYAFPMQCKGSLGVSPEIWKRSVSSPQLYMVPCSIATIRTSLTRTSCWPLRISLQKQIVPFWNECLAMRLITRFCPKIWRNIRLNVVHLQFIKHISPNELLRHLHISSQQLELCF